MAAVSSLTAFSVHVGFTIYLSRVVTVLFLASLLLSAANRDGRLRIGKVHRGLIALFGLLLFVQSGSLLIAPNKTAALSKILIYVFLMTEFSVIQLASTNARILIRGLWLYISMGVFQAIFGIYQVVGFFKGWPMLLSLMDFLPAGNPNHRLGAIVDEAGFPRAFGTVTEPNNYAGFMVIVLICAVVLLLNWKRVTGNRRLFLLIVFGSSLSGIVLSGSRSGLITVTAAVPLVAIFSHGGRIFRGAHPFKMVPAALVVSGLLIGILFMAGRIVTGQGMERTVLAALANRVSLLWRSEGPLADYSDIEGHVSDIEGHVRSRMLGLEAFSRNPILGVGVGNFGEYYSAELQEQNLGSHSHHIDVLAETGLMGALIEWSIMGVTLVTMLRGVRAAYPGSSIQIWLLGMASAYAGIIFGNLLYHYYLNDFVWYIMATGVSLAQQAIAVRRGSTITLLKKS